MSASDFRASNEAVDCWLGLVIACKKGNTGGSLGVRVGRATDGAWMSVREVCDDLKRAEKSERAHLQIEWAFKQLRRTLSDEQLFVRLVTTNPMETAGYPGLAPVVP